MTAGLSNHNIIALERKIRIDDLLAGPAEGWHWEAEGDALPIHLLCRKPPLSFVEPMAVSMLGAWAFHQRHLGREIIIDDTVKSPVAFNSGLLSAIAGRDKGPSSSTDHHFVRLTFERDALDVLDPLVERMNLPDHAERVAVHCLSDLADNVFHHASTRGQGAFCSIAFDRESRRVRLAVADCGRGIPASIKPNYDGALDDETSLRLALEPEFSGMSARPEVNRGVGLYVVRRLALAANGAFCAVTEGLSVRASALSPSAFIPSIFKSKRRWQGTTVAVTFIADGADFDGPMAAIRHEIEGCGPKYKDIQFFKKSEPTDGWTCVKIGCDRGKFAVSRERALAIAEKNAPLLAAGAKLELDFTGIVQATQAFCHALLVTLLSHGGDRVLERLRFVGCSRHNHAPIRFAVNFVTDQKT